MSKDRELFLAAGLTEEDMAWLDGLEVRFRAGGVATENELANADRLHAMCVAYETATASAKESHR
jgi:hypothetical protein